MEAHYGALRLLMSVKAQPSSMEASSGEVGVLMVHCLLRIIAEPMRLYCNPYANRAFLAESGC